MDRGEELQDGNDGAETLKALTRDLASTRDVPRLLHHIADLALRAGGAAAAHLERVDMERGEVEVIATSGDAQTSIGVRVPFPGSLAEEALRRNVPEVVSADELARRPAAGLLPAACRDCPALVIPLVSEDEALGALILLRRPELPPFTNDDLHQLGVLGDVAALALRRLLLQHHLERGVRALEQSEQREREAREAAERASHAKSDFLATMSHELRTPINAIVGYSDLLDAEIAGPLNESQRAYLFRVRASGRHLLSLVGDVLDMARIEAGRVDLEPRPTRLDELIAETIAILEPQADARELTVAHACGDEDGVLMRTDPDRLRQVLLNLVGNAVKYTQPGGRVTVTCSTVAEPPRGVSVAGEGPWAVLRVQDTGVGISAERLERIWEPFEQADSGRTRSSEGTGLGLSISRSLARLMGGDIIVHSEPDVGSTFLLVLPCGTTPEDETAARERRGPARHASGISIVGTAIRAEVESIIGDYVALLRADPDLPSAWSMSDADLEDHTATLLVDIADAIGSIEEAAGAPSQAVRDAQDIQRLIAHRRGRSRARCGWSPAELRRDYLILRDALERAVRNETPALTHDRLDGAAVEHGLVLVRRFLERAERVSLAALENG
jgi:signal transduction histidine kinase